MDNDAIARLNILTAAMTATAEKTSANFMLYGMSSAGKSHLALEVAEQITKPGKVIFHVDTSGNKDRVLEYVNLTHPYANLVFTTIEDLRILTQAMAEGVGPYAHIGTIILDEASSMAKDDLDRIYEARVAAIDAGQIKMPKDGRPDTPDWADYRPTLQRFRSMLSNLYKIPGLNVILVAHETVDPKLNSMIVPDFSPEIRKAVKAKLSLMARLVADEVTPLGSEEVVYTRTVQINPTRSVDAKSCLGTATIRFSSEFLPGVVKGWLDRGAIPEPEQPRVEDVHAPAINVEVDETPDPVNPDTTDEDFTFSPIN